MRTERINQLRCLSVEGKLVRFFYGWYMHSMRKLLILPTVIQTMLDAVHVVVSVAMS